MSDLPIDFEYPQNLEGVLLRTSHFFHVQDGFCLCLLTVFWLNSWSYYKRNYFKYYLNDPGSG